MSLIRFCIAALYTITLATSGAPAPDVWPRPDATRVTTGEWQVSSRAADDPDRLYSGRENLPSARRAAEIWSAQLARDPKAYDAAWKLARARYWLGGHVPLAERRRALELGIEAGRLAVAARPDRPEGHFWLAANMGALAESSGFWTGLRLRTSIREELETVLKIDPAWEQGSADRALGRWYFKVPAAFGGSKKESEAHLRRSLQYNPTSTASRYFLAETLIAMDRKAEARAELQKVIDAPFDPDWAPEDREFKDKARQLLQKIAE